MVLKINLIRKREEEKEQETETVFNLNYGEKDMNRKSEILVLWVHMPVCACVHTCGVCTCTRMHACVCEWG